MLLSLDDILSLITLTLVFAEVLKLFVFYLLLRVIQCSNIWVNKYKRVMMHRGTLVDLLFETPPIPQKGLKEKDKDTFFRKPHSGRGSNIIKITQFNSSLVIGEEKVHRRELPLSSSNSPQKNFTIKKVGDTKGKMSEAGRVAVTAQKMIELQIKKKERNISFSHDAAKPSIEKILVTTRCNIKNQATNIQSLTSGIVETDIIDRSLDLSLTRFLTSQKRELKHSKEMLGNKNSNGSEKHFEFMDLGGQEVGVWRKSTGSPRRHYSRHIQQQKKYQQKLQQEKRQILQLKKELNKNYAKPFNPPQNITANAFIVYQADAKKSKLMRKLSSLRQNDNPENSELRKTLLNSHKVVVSSNSRAAVQIASLTKIMTCILILDIAKKHNIDLKQEFVTIGSFQQNIGGTSANIQKGEIYSVEQLLHGLMLPSGNDASLALAVWGGKLLLQREAKGQALSSTATSDTGTSWRKKDCYQRFVVQMNNKAAELNMEKTKYANSHGLSNPQNRSCAYDLAILCEYAMKDQNFRDIVSCRRYQTTIGIQNEDFSGKEQIEAGQNSLSQGMLEHEEMKDLEENQQLYNQQINQQLQNQDANGECSEVLNEEVTQIQQNKDNSTKFVRWQNTHHLLQTKPNLYVGIKTGITDTAGPCLASCIQIGGKRYIIIVLNCKTLKHRFRDTQILRKWLFSKEEIKYKEQGRAQVKLQAQGNSTSLTQSNI